MPIIINGQTEDITIGGESVAVDSEVAPISHNHTASNITDLDTLLASKGYEKAK